MSKTFLEIYDRYSKKCTIPICFCLECASSEEHIGHELVNVEKHFENKIKVYEEIYKFLRNAFSLNMKKLLLTFWFKKLIYIKTHIK